MREQWDLLASVLVLALGAGLVALGHPDEGRNLLSLGAGLITGVVLGRRRARGGATIPPVPPLAVLAAIAALAGATATGCSGTPPTGTCRAVQAATRAACAAVEQAEAEALACEAPPDAGAP